MKQNVDMMTKYLSVDIGPEVMRVNTDGVWVRSGRDEIEHFIEQQVKPDIQSFTEEKKELFNQNAVQKTSDFNENAETQTKANL